MTDQRLAALLDVMTGDDIDAVALVPGPTFVRLLGHAFHQNERPLVLIVTRDGRMAAVVPALESASFDRIGLDCTVFLWRDEEGYADAFAELGAWIAENGVRGIALEGQRMRAFEYRALESACPGVTLTDAQKRIARVRLYKTDEEISKLREAIRISETALASTLERVRTGMTETEIERMLVQTMFAEGASGLGFSPIVAAADNSAMPHASARADYAVKPGDALLFDFGASFEGYTADITRTVFVGHVDDEDAALYETVRAANEIGRQSARSGTTCDALDDAVLSHLEASPFAAFKRHKTGHGLGLEVHEEPYIMRGNLATLEPGMVFTVEPGLYRLGRLGVRIEDDVLVTGDGAESLTSFPRDLTILPG